ncbi:single-stranded DNA-binding protein [Pasteurella multocida]|uniref:single-stranded DNA-binding protein n=2 Tax=Pasteurella multocida TaxID=747 RepID=UPI000352A60D|nr:single-stranded DNA-binding protein [Pasteurella multocida]AUK48472.1 single-stranded DNA-binding protein [Pasteurella multocida]AUK48865.1 single-stranded DNA-binding protein [Pasteurella multocida]AUK53078.1 single-stranded DNA-binding protein [Pasteurella multocida]AUK53473.1 single-stranded DNA-binding protein [Pasteurella multocida]ESQ72261.1 single-stranded DNA-binding protein [Pasteurella multocida subsp. multocida P1062]
MAGVNKVIIVGNLGQNPDYKVMTNGDPVTNISVATSEVWADKASGEKREVVEWHRITIYRRQADIAAQFLKKGSKVYVEGRLKTRKWQDQSGQERYITEILADKIVLLDSKQSASAGNGSPPPAQQQHDPYGDAFNCDNIPF